MLPVFDGHNDALTADGHEALASGRDDGHLDIPRMKTGGVRGAIFAVFSPSDEDHDWEPITRDDGALAVELADAGSASAGGGVRVGGGRAPCQPRARRTRHDRADDRRPRRS